MIRKDDSVECEIDPILMDFLFWVDDVYRAWGSELVITSGSEDAARHSFTSLHYAKPSRAADIRTWERDDVPNGHRQQIEVLAKANEYCRRKGIPLDWIEVILESSHIHLEYQPKRKKL